MNKMKEWISHLEKNQKIILIFILLSFLAIFSLSLWNTINVPIEKSSAKSVTISLVNDKLVVKDTVEDEDVKDDQEDQTSQQETAKSEKNQTDEEGQSSISHPVQDGSSSNVDSEGTKEENKQETENVHYLTIPVTIKGLNGTMILTQNVQVEEGQSAFEALAKVCQANGLSLNATGFGKTIYVSEIAGLKEKQYGAASGWKYRINGNYVSIGAGGYTLQEGDVMEWYYIHD